MTISILLRLLIPALIFISCTTRTEIKVEKVELVPVKKHINEPDPAGPPGLKVAAFLVYKDGSFSSFDVLNDKTKALWNVIAGEGDAEKPSSSTKVEVTGRLHGLHLKILKGKKKVVDEALPDFSGVYEIILKDTGCEIVKVYVTQNRKEVFHNDIEFHCGE